MSRSSLLPVLLAGGGVSLVLWAGGWIESESFLVAGSLCIGIAAWDALRDNRRSAAPVIVDSAPAAPDPGLIGGRIPFPLLLLGGDGVVQYANEPAADLLGGIAKGAHISIAIRDPGFLEALASARQSGEWRESEFGLGHDPKRQFRAWIRSPRTPGPAKGPEAEDVLVCLEDRTQFHRSQILHRDFVANASHELRTPLATVAGCIETIRGNARNDPVASERFTDIMQRETDRMRRIVSDLLSLNSVEMQEHVLPTDRVDATAIVREALESRPSALQAGATVRTPENALFIHGSRIELLHALDNILVNAETHADGVSAVVVRRVASKVEIAIEARGPGVAKEHLSRLTERFYRVDAPGSRGRGGTGLGLAIVKHVVSRHKGELLTESEQGAGSRFTLRFDIVAEFDSGA